MIFWLGLLLGLFIGLAVGVSAGALWASRDRHDYL